MTDFISANIISHYNYWVSIILMMVGFYAVINSGNFVKKLMGLAIFQTSVLLFFISIAYVRGGYFPILDKDATLYMNPLPHVLMLTAIVVGIAVLAVGLSIVVQIKKAYGTVEEDEVLQKEAHNATVFHNHLQQILEKDGAPKPKRSRAPKKKVEKK